MPADPGFVVGYSEVVGRFEKADEAGTEPDYDNPYQDGTEAHRGFVEGMYDLTQK